MDTQEWYEEWLRERTLSMMKDPHIDNQILKSTAPHSKPHTSTSQSSPRDDERVAYVAQALRDFSPLDESMDIYVEVAQVAIDAVREFASKSTTT